MSNPYEDRNRAIKVDKLVESLTAAGLALGLTDRQIADAARGLDTAGRDAADAVAGTIPGSDETWALVIRRLDRMVEIAKDPFAGLPQGVN